MHVVPGIKTLLAELNATLDELEKTVQPTWEGLVEPLERLSDRIECTWGAVSHLKVSRPLHAGLGTPGILSACCSTLHQKSLMYKHADHYMFVLLLSRFILPALKSGLILLTRR